MGSSSRTTRGDFVNIAWVGVVESCIKETPCRVLLGAGANPQIRLEASSKIDKIAILIVVNQKSFSNSFYMSLPTVGPPQKY